MDLIAHTRDKVGKSAAKKIRITNNIPCTLYGKNSNEINAVNISVNKTDFSKIVAAHEGENLIFTLKINDSSEKIVDTKTVIIKDIQRDPIKEDIIHVDFQHILLDKKLRTKVPVILRGKPEGVKSGGVLEHIVHELEIECLPLDIPKYISVDVSHLALNQSLHAKAIPQQEKIRILSNGDLTIAVVATIRKEEEKEVKKEEQVAAEPELVSKKGKAEETEETKEAAAETKPGAKPAGKPAAGKQAAK